MNFVVTAFICFVYFHSIHTDFSYVTAYNYNDEDYFCDNLYYADKSVLQNIHKCFCEPYNKSDLDGKSSIVRFPVRHISLKIRATENYRFL